MHSMSNDTFILNYPELCPQFCLPPFPSNLPPVPQPQPPKRNPVPGYDMRTLRKQLEFLYTQIEERTLTQKQLSLQNQDLNNYLLLLHEANLSNRSRMKSYVDTANQQLTEAYQQRISLSQKLHIVINSKESMARLQDEFLQLKQQRREEEERAASAQATLQRHQELHDTAQQQLQTEVESLRNRSTQLQDIKDQMTEDDAVDKADIFFHTHKSILKSAFSRFCRAHKNIRRGVTEYYAKESQKHFSYKMKLKALKCWRERSLLSQIILEGDRRRNYGVLKVAMITWKVHIGIEKLCQQARRKRLLQQTFTAWSLFTNMESKGKRHAIVIQEIRQNLLLKRVFTEWRKEANFLDWSNPKITYLGLLAIKHFASRLIHAWKRETIKSSDFHRLRIVQIKTISLQGKFRQWQRACERVWCRRGILLRTFFSNSKFTIESRIIQSLAADAAMMKRLELLKRWVLNQWYFYTSQVRNRMATRRRITYIFDGSKSTANHHMSKIARVSLFTWLRNISLQANSRTTYQTSVIYFNRRTVSNILQFWYQITSITRQQRMQREHIKLRNSLHIWSSLTAAKKFIQLKVSTSISLHNKKKRKILKLKFYWWLKLTKITRRLRHIASFIKTKIQFEAIRKVFKIWQQKFNSGMLLKIREATIKNKNDLAINELQMKDLSDLFNEQKKLEQQANDLESASNDLEVLCSNHSNSLLESRTIIEEKHRQRTEAEDRIRTKLIELQNLRHEGERLQQIEEILTVSFEKERKKQRKIRATEEKLVQKLQALSNRSVEEAKKTSEANDHLRAQLQTAINAAENAEERLATKQRELRDLTADRDTIREQLHTVQRQLQTVAREGELALVQEEQGVRKLAARVAVLRSNSGLATARVRELQSIVGHLRTELSTARMNEVMQSERRELNKISKITKEYH